MAPSCILWFWWWWIFSLHNFGLLLWPLTKCPSFKHNLPVHCHVAMPIPLWPQCIHLLVGVPGRGMCHVTNLKSSQTGLRKNPIYIHIYIRTNQLEPTENYKDIFCLGQLGRLCVRIWLVSGLQPCVYYRVNGSAMAVSAGECREGLPTVCVCQYLFACGCACVEQWWGVVWVRWWWGYAAQWGRYGY